MSRRYFNGVKTFGLLLGMWVLMLGLGAVIGDGKYICPSSARERSS